METGVLLVSLAALLACCQAATVEDLETQMQQLKLSMDKLTRDMMIQEYRQDENARTTAASGLRTVRGTMAKGTKSYYTSSYLRHAIAAIHNHGNNVRTLGMGELSAVLNGVEFRTRHNDFSLTMKSQVSSTLGETADIPFPEVPPEVLAKPSVDEQVAEMQEWFKAWQAGDSSVRDYRPYFKAALCYLEGAWLRTNDSNDNIDEIFFSDRHQLKAGTWTEMEERIRFSALTGRDDEDEGLAFLPRKIFGQDANGIPIVGQWNYQILCHPVAQDLPLNRLRVVDDLKARMQLSLKMKREVGLQDLEVSRLARFQLNTVDRNTWKEESRSWTMLDELMGQIPGLNNNGVNLTDDAFDLETTNYDTGEPLNAAFFHRLFKVNNIGAMGTRTRARVFNDPLLFMAMTTHPSVLSADYGSWSQRWSFAIPLEIVYMTPLSKWNPYDIAYKGDHKTTEADTVTQGPSGTRDGTSHPDFAYNGTHSKTFFMTPSLFYDDSSDTDEDMADTSGVLYYALDRNGNVREVRATGVQITLPAIPNVGLVRLRYPIMPISDEGNSIWKELQALTDIMMEPDSFTRMSRHYAPRPILACLSAPGPLTDDRAEDKASNAYEADMAQGIFTDVTMYLLAHKDAVTNPHYHTVNITPAQMYQLCQGEFVAITTDTAENHVHELEVKKVYALIQTTGSYRVKYITKRCDGTVCGDSGHDRRLVFQL